MAPAHTCCRCCSHAAVHRGWAARPTAGCRAKVEQLGAVKKRPPLGWRGFLKEHVRYMARQVMGPSNVTSMWCGCPDRPMCALMAVRSSSYRSHDLPASCAPVQRQTHQCETSTLSACTGPLGLSPSHSAVHFTTACITSLIVLSEHKKPLKQHLHAQHLIDSACVSKPMFALASEAGHLTQSSAHHSAANMAASELRRMRHICMQRAL